MVTIPGKGRGLVADRPFARDELIERAPVVVISRQDWELIQETEVSCYCFNWGSKSKDAAIALGRSSLINHSYTPNAYAQPRHRQRMMDFVALRDIDVGEEITINYNGEPDDRAPVDFEVYGE